MFLHNYDNIDQPKKTKNCHKAEKRDEIKQAHIKKFRKSNFITTF